MVATRRRETPAKINACLRGRSCRSPELIEVIRSAVLSAWFAVLLQPMHDIIRNAIAFFFSQFFAMVAEIVSRSWAGQLFPESCGAQRFPSHNARLRAPRARSGVP